MGMYYLFYEGEEWKLLIIIYNFRQELMVWKFVWGYWGKAYGWFYGLGSGKDGRKEHWKEIESMNAWMAQEWQAERGKQCVAFKKCMRKSSGKKDQREGELLNVTWERIPRWRNRWDDRKVYERWTLMMSSCDNVRRCVRERVGEIVSEHLYMVW